MRQPKRFTDKKLTIADFHNEVLVKCPRCEGKAIAISDNVTQIAKLTCTACGYNQTQSMHSANADTNAAAHTYFSADLWLQKPFGDHMFCAYNEKHLLYLEDYIAAHLRESANRDGFTMVEKLPAFIQDGTNRKPLLKLIDKFKKTLHPLPKSQ